MKKISARTTRILLVTIIGLIIIIFLMGKSLLPGYTLVHFDLINELYLPWANDIKYPKITDHYAVDQIQEMYPLQKWHAQQLKNGNFPLWDPYDQGGLAYHENSVRLPLHPFKFLLLILPVDQVFDITIIIHFIFSFLAMAYYLSRNKLRLLPILFGATSWALCAFFVNNYPREGLIASIGLIPLVVALLDNLFQKQNLKSSLIYGAGLGVTLLISEPVGFLVLLLVISSRIIGVLIWERKYLSLKVFKCFILGGIVGILIAAVNILATAHAFSTSLRTYVGVMEYQQSFNWFLGYILSLLSVGTNAFYPFLLGSKDSLDILKLFGLNIQYSVYFGVLGFLLIPFGFKTLKKSEFKWLLILALIILITITPLLIPIMKARTLVAFTFLLIVIASSGMDNLLDISSVKLKKYGILISLFSVGLTIVLFIKHFIILHYFTFLHNKLTLFIENNLKGLHLERYAEWKLNTVSKFIDQQLVTSEQNIFLIIILFSFSILILLGAYLNNKKYVVVAGLIAFVPPILYSYNNIHIINKSKYPTPILTPGLQFIKENIGHERMFCVRNDDYDINGRLLLIKNQVEDFSIRNLGGIGSFQTYQPQRLLRIKNLKNPLSDELGIKYLVWSKFSHIDSSLIKEIVYNDEIVIAEKLGNPNRCWVVSNLVQETSPEVAICKALDDDRGMGSRIHYVDRLPAEYKQDTGLAGTANIIHEDENIVDIFAKLNKPGLLILSDTWYTGWKVIVNGKEEPILRTDGALRGVWLSPGEYKVKFIYQPKMFYLGFVISLITVFILIILYIKVAIKNNKPC